MRITVVRHSIRNRGGDKLILDYLAHLSSRGHEIIYWTNEIHTDFAIPPQIKMQQIPIPKIVGTILFSLFKKFKTDILLVDLVVLAFFGSWRNKRELIYLAQGHDVSYHKSAILKSFIKFCYQKVLGNLRIPTVCVSNGLAETLQIYSSKPLKIITNGVSLKNFYADKNSPFSKNRPQRFAILLFSRKDLAKGFDTAEEALRRLMILRPQKDWEAWAIGEEKIEWNFVPVKNLGFQSDETKLRGILSAADIFLVPSRSEGLSLLLLQALACECAVVSTKASSILTHEVDGLVSPIEDADTLAQNLDRALNDEILRKKLKANARVLAQRFDLEKSSAEFENFLKTLPPRMIS